MSNTIGNVPAVILLMTVWPPPPEGALYGLALLSTLAGNLLLVGSLANLIVAERAAAAGVRLGFIAFAPAGIPVTDRKSVGPGKRVSGRVELGGRRIIQQKNT